MNRITTTFCKSVAGGLSRVLCLALFITAWAITPASAQVSSAPLRVAFLGDNGHHRPSDLYRAIKAPMAKANIELVYSDDVAGTLNDTNLAKYDALLIYANIDEISKEQEAAMLDFVAGGKALIPVHCATYCFRNSNRYIELVGAQFKEHGGERFSTEIVEPDHPIMKGFGGFESWDETYIHYKHNTVDRIVLEERRMGKLAENTTGEPWTWVRTHGSGRVFYTAWGHNMDTWGQPGFHNLLQRGIMWACKRDTTTVPAFVDEKRFPIPSMTEPRKDVAAFTYTDVGDKIPNYTPGPKWGEQAKPMSRMQNPLDASESIKHFVTPKSFEMKVWATEAASADDKKGTNYAGLAGKPLAMNWDHKGRLWLCESIDYPNELQPRGKGRDRIRICEDTDHDGTADKFTVFATNLSIPTALVCYRDGVLVQDGQETVYLKDTNGDDVADMRQVLITGWAMGDTHGGVSNFQYGLDNWIWAMQGYNDSRPVINGERQQGFRQGFWRFAVEQKPSSDTAPVYALTNGVAASARSKDFDAHSLRVSKLEFIRSTDNNTWGLGIAEDGLIFGSTANGNPSGFMPIANRYYERVKGWSPEVLHTIANTDKFKAITPNVRQVDHHGGYTAAAGHALYTARRYPSSWWNRIAFVCEPTGHIVGSFVLNRDGAGYRSTNPFNLVASDDEWSSPTMAEIGPDGNVWVIDWYNFIVQHNPTPNGFKTGKGAAYESDLRDKKYGRIYRVVYNGNEGLDAKALAAADATIKNGLDPAKESELVAALRHPTMLWRKTAQRLLVEKNSLKPETVAALRALTADTSTDQIGLNVGAVHALWVLTAIGQSQGVVDNTASLSKLLKHPSPAVRRNAIVVAPENAASLAALIDANAFQDSDLQVRLATLLKAADISEDHPKLASVLAQPDQLVVRESDGATDRWLTDAWTSAAATHAGTVLPALMANKNLKANNAIVRAIATVAEHAARSRLSEQQLESITNAPANVELAAAVINGLVEGWPKDYVPTVTEKARTQLLDNWLNGSLPVDTKSQVIQLAQLCKVRDMDQAISQIRSDLLKRFEDESAADTQRVAAAKQVIVLQPESSELVDALLEQISAQTSPEFSSGVLEGLNSSRAENLAAALIEKSRSLPPEFRRGVIRLLMNRPATTMDLLNAIEQGKLTLSDLQLDQKQALRDHPSNEVKTKALAIMKSMGGVPNADRQKVLDAWMDVTKESGDAVNGKAMYQKHCALCHKHGDLGVNIGPNLTGMAVHPKAELLMNILDPSRSVEGNFKTYNIRTSAGTILTGMLAGESKTSLEIVNSLGKREVVLREDIEELIASQKSLMPEGFEGQINKQEMRDLLEFLTSKGKYVPMAIDSIATSVTTKGMFWDEKNTIESLVFPDWTPKTFKDVPFILIDPQDGRVPNAIMLHGPMGNYAPKMPKQVELTCQTPAVAIHMLSGVGGWSYPASGEGSTSAIVRLTYANGETEDHPLINGQHFADYIRRVDVPKSEFAFDLAGRQIRYLSIQPKKRDMLQKIELIKGQDITAPVFMAITIQTSE